MADQNQISDFERRYVKIETKPLGEGTYGEVYKVRRAGKVVGIQAARGRHVTYGEVYKVRRLSGEVEIQMDKVKIDARTGLI
jgi:hypothetical protein